MGRMNRNRILLVVLAVGAAFLIFNPFRGSKAPINRLPSANLDTVALLASYVERHYLTPENYIIKTFDNHQIVFLGEPGRIKQNVDLVRRIIPNLYRHGVRNLGIEYALSRDQQEIDRLTTAPVYDQALANKLLFDYLVVWGFRQYADIFKAAWAFNRTLPKGDPPFRIVGLGVAQDWQFLKTKADAQNPRVLHEVLSNGIPDQHMANIIERKFIATNSKALIFVSTASAFTAYINTAYAETMQKMGFNETERAGNIVHDMIGAKSFTILFHQLWPAKDNSHSDYPVGGLVDRVIKRLPASERNAGFNIDGTPFAELPITTSAFASGHRHLTFGQLTNGYIIQGPIADYSAVAPIPNFITPANLETALADFPGPKPGKVSAYNLNSYIRNSLTNLGSYLHSFE